MTELTVSTTQVVVQLTTQSGQVTTLATPLPSVIVAMSGTQGPAGTSLPDFSTLPALP